MARVNESISELAARPRRMIGEILNGRLHRTVIPTTILTSGRKWSASIGMTGRFPSEPVIGIDRNQWSVSVKICNYTSSSLTCRCGRVGVNRKYIGNGMWTVSEKWPLP